MLKVRLLKKERKSLCFVFFCFLPLDFDGVWQVIPATSHSHTISHHNVTRLDSISGCLSFIQAPHSHLPSPAGGRPVGVPLQLSVAPRHLGHDRARSRDGRDMVGVGGDDGRLSRQQERLLTPSLVLLLRRVHRVTSLQLRRL